MYTEDFIKDAVQAVENAKELVSRHMTALLTAQDLVNDTQQDLLHMLVQNEKESYGIEQIALTEYYIKTVDYTMRDIKGSAVGTRTSALLSRITDRVKLDYYGLSNYEAVALHILKSKTADDALDAVATIDDRDLYVPIRKNLLDIIFEKAGADLYELADSNVDA